MSATTEAHVEPAVGQIYESARNETRYQILYVDDQIVLLRCEDSHPGGENSHRIEPRHSFDKNVEAGFFDYKPDSSLDLIEFEERDWSEVSYIGEQTAENLHDAGFDTNLDIQQADDAALLGVDGVGKTGLENLRDFAR